MFLRRKRKLSLLSTSFKHVKTAAHQVEIAAEYRRTLCSTLSSALASRANLAASKGEPAIKAKSASDFICQARRTSFCILGMIEGLSIADSNDNPENGSLQFSGSKYLLKI